MSKNEEQAKNMGKESSKYAFIFDRQRAERERGITITPSQKSLQVNDKKYSVISNPGIRDFIKSMMSNVLLSDAVVFVVPADVGSFENSMSKEGMNKRICDILLGAQSNQIIVAINKMDAANYSSERFNEIKEEMKSLMIRRSFKKQFVEENVAFIPLSGWSGDNLIEKSEKMHWWDGCEVKKTNGKKVLCFTLLDILNDFIKIPKRKEKDVPLRASVDAHYQIRGIGDVVTVKCEQGIVNVGDEVAFLPSHTENKPCTGKILSIQSSHTYVQKAFPGSIFALNIEGLTTGNLPKKGDVMILKSDESLKVCNRFTASVRVLEHPGQIKKGYSPISVFSSSSVATRVHNINWKMKLGSKEKEVDASFVESRDVAEIVFESVKPLAIDINCQSFTKMIMIEMGGPTMIGKVIETDTK